jgi:hypothetical protein
MALTMPLYHVVSSPFWVLIGLVTDGWREEALELRGMTSMGRYGSQTEEWNICRSIGRKERERTYDL